jgi:D-lactate dehydrogenase (cytochrome)
VPVARIEFLDQVMLRGVNVYSNTSYAETPTLFYEFHGSEASVARGRPSAGEVAREHGAAVSSGRRGLGPVETVDRAG